MPTVAAACEGEGDARRRGGVAAAGRCGWWGRPTAGGDGRPAGGDGGVGGRGGRAPPGRRSDDTPAAVGDGKSTGRGVSPSTTDGVQRLVCSHEKNQGVQSVPCRGWTVPSNVEPRALVIHAHDPVAAEGQPGFDGSSVAAARADERQRWHGQDRCQARTELAATRVCQSPACRLPDVRGGLLQTQAYGGWPP